MISRAAASVRSQIRVSRGGNLRAEPRYVRIVLLAADCATPDKELLIARSEPSRAARTPDGSDSKSFRLIVTLSPSLDSREGLPAEEELQASWKAKI